MISYTQEQTMQAFKIYAQLAAEGIAQVEHVRVYMADDVVRGIVDQFAREVECAIFPVGECLYMVPVASDSGFHVSNESIKKDYFPQKAKNLDIYMMYVTMIILFGEFYDSYQTVEATREFISVAQWLKSVNERIFALKEYSEDELKEIESEHEYNWSAILEKWEAMDDLKENARQTARTISRMSFLGISKNFLKDQGLVQEIGNDEIQLTEKAKTIIQRYYMEQEYNRGILEFIYSMENKEDCEYAGDIQD